METYILAFLIIALAVVLICIIHSAAKPKYDKRGFDINKTHRNGTKFDDQGYDYLGYDAFGYDTRGYDRRGYDKGGYNRQGYNNVGRNSKGQYNRYYDVKVFETEEFSSEGFKDPRNFPVALTDHARLRMRERLGVTSYVTMDELAFEVYQYGKSARQINKSTAARVTDIEGRHDNGIVLVYRNYIYIFSSDNVLITLYRNDNIYH